jgi:hypothetical protein
MDLVFNTFAFEAYRECTMTSQDSWMFRKLAACNPLSSTVPKIAQELRYIATTLYYCVLEPRKTRWLAASVLASSTGGSDHDRDGIHRGSYNKYVFAASMFHIFTFCTKSEVSKSCSTERVSKMRAVLATSSPSVGRCIPSRLHARHSEISTVLHRRFLQQGDLFDRPTKLIWA